MLVRSSAPHPSWSPDGLTVVVEDDTADTSPLLSVRIAAGTATPIAGTAGGSDPAIAKDGRIAFVAAQGIPALLTPGSSTPTELWPTTDAWHPVWSPDGRRLDYDTTFTSGGVEHVGYVQFIGPQATSLVSGSDDWDHVDPAMAYVDSQAPALTATAAPSATSNARPTFVATDDATATGAWPTGARSTAERRRRAYRRGSVAPSATARTRSFTGPAGPAGPVTLSSTVAFTYGSTDAGFGIAPYDVQYAIGTAAAGLSGWLTPTGWTGRTATTVPSDVRSQFSPPMSVA